MCQEHRGFHPECADCRKPDSVPFSLLVPLYFFEVSQCFFHPYRALLATPRSVVQGMGTASVFLHAGPPIFLSFGLEAQCWDMNIIKSHVEGSQN